MTANSTIGIRWDAPKISILWPGSPFTDRVGVVCGRVVYYLSPAEMQMGFRLFDTHQLDLFEPRYNIPPTGLAACIRWNEDEQRRESFAATWGLIPSWARDVKIAASCSNARSDTVEVKPAFRSAYKRRRCIVAVNGFYEWDQINPLKKGEKKQPFYFSMKDSRIMPFAGLWESWIPPKKSQGTDEMANGEPSPSEQVEPVISCTIITTEPNSLMRPLHDRLPVILPSEVWDAWLDPEADPMALKELLVPYDSDAMEYWPVTKEMNATRVKVDGQWTRNDKPEFIKPIQLDKTLFQ